MWSQAQDMRTPVPRAAWLVGFAVAATAAAWAIFAHLPPLPVRVGTAALGASVPLGYQLSVFPAFGAFVGALALDCVRGEARRTWLFRAALVGSIGHASDIGGTRDSLNVREVYDEGLQIPPLKLYRRGAVNEDLVAMIRANVRRPEMVVGDIQSQVSSNRVGANRLVRAVHAFVLGHVPTVVEKVAIVVEQGRGDERVRRPFGAGQGRALQRVIELGHPLAVVLVAALPVEGEDLVDEAVHGQRPPPGAARRSSRRSVASSPSRSA